MRMNGKKLRLNVEELEVEAFATAGDAVERGTVHGHDYTPATCDVGYSCPGPDPGFCRLTYPATGCDC
jgi:hypothetical protein